MNESTAKEERSYARSLINAIRKDQYFIYFISLGVIAFYSLVAQLMIIVSLMCLLDYEDMMMLYVGIPVSLLLTAVASFIEKDRIENYAHYLARRFQSSDIIERLADGWDQLVEIYDHVPFPWTFFLGPKPKELSTSVSLIIRNMDWYLDPPRKFVNPYWVLTLVGWIASVSGYVCFRFLSKNELFSFILIVSLLAAPGAFVYYHYQGRRHFAARLLHDELVNRLEQ